MDWPDIAAKVAFFALMGYIFWLDRDYPRRAPPGHSLGRRVLRNAVRPPVYPRIPMDQDADTPHRAAQGEE